MTWKVTDLLIGVNMEKYRQRLRRINRPVMRPLEMLALELHVREALRSRGVDPFSVDIQGEFMDFADPMLTYGENKTIMDDMISKGRLP